MKQHKQENGHVSQEARPSLILGGNMRENPVVITGMGGAFPGAVDLDKYWQLIRDAADVARDLPPERTRISIHEVHRAGEPAPDKVTGTRACLVEPVAPDFSRLQLGPEQIERLDPLFTLGLYAAQKAWDDAATDRLDLTRVGVILGNIVLPTDHTSKQARNLVGKALAEKAGVPFEAEGSDEPLDQQAASLPAALIAQALGLGGGGFTLDAACASSLFALKLAVEELRAGRLDAVITGGISRPDCLYTQMGFSQLRALSPTGKASPFDAAGNGLVVGEGAGMFVLKRLDDALAQGDTIHAVIEGIGWSNDTDGSLLAPSSEGQLRAMRQAYEQAGLRPSDVDLIECHATGTPLGDQVEFASLCELWREEPQDRHCVVGSVKGTVGHLLTAAGAASLTKVLLAFRHETLPPTSNFRTPAPKIGLADSPFRILQQTEAWPETGRPRRAAVSAFGFGGTNAHVLLRQWREEEPVPAPVDRKETPAVAIVGIGAALGACHDLSELATALMGTGAPAEKGPGRGFGLPGLPKGHFAESLALPYGAFRIPPKELAEMLPQQLLYLLVSRAALDDAGIAVDEVAQGGTFVGIALDPNTTNYQLRWDLEAKVVTWNERLGLNLSPSECTAWAQQLREAAGPALDANRVLGGLGGLVGSRVARETRFGGPSLSLAAAEGSGLRALECAVRALQRGELDLALSGAVDFGGDVRTLIAENGGGADAAVALVLKRLDDAERDGDKIYAVLRGFGAAREEQAALDRAMAEAELETRQIAYLDRATLDRPLDLALPEQETYHQERRVASTCQRLGISGAASGAMSLLTSVLALHHRILPGEDPIHWLRNRLDGPRRAAVTTSHRDGLSSAIVLEGYDACLPSISAIPPLDEAVLVIRGDETPGLVTELKRFIDWANQRLAHKPAALAAAWMQEGRGGERALALVSDRVEALVEAAEVAVAALSEHGTEAEQAPEFARLSRNGRIHFRSQPLGKDAPMAFVFPGSGSHFHGMGKQLALRFPQSFLKQDTRTLYLADELRPDLFWGAQANETVDQEHRALLSAQVALDIAMADLARRFGMKMQATVGYSLGETSALFATEAWAVHDEMHLRTKNSHLFQTELAGRCEAVRAHWGLTDEEEVDWTVAMIQRPAQEVRELLADNPRVYMLISNAPEECVIGGNRAAVEAFAQSLDLRYFPLPGVVSVHSEALGRAAEAYREHHLFETHTPADIAVYSGAWCKSYEVTRERAADALLAQALHGVDFPNTVRAAYEDGYRYFIEMGPGRSCARMIEQTLTADGEDRPYFTRSICVSGNRVERKLLRVLAGLAAEGYPVDLSPLYEGISPRKTEARTLTVPLAGAPFASVPRPERRKPKATVRPAIQPKVQKPVNPETVTEKPSMEPVVSHTTPTHREPLIEGQMAGIAATRAAHEAYLVQSQKTQQAMATMIERQMQLLQAMDSSGSTDVAVMQAPPQTVAEAVAPPNKTKPARDVAFDREMCLEFARGSIGRMLGSEFAEIDTYPTRVRLPDEPLMLVDRIVEVHGEAMTQGFVATEHDVLSDGWYLDNGHMCTCVAIESGQADLFLGAWLGIDFKTKGKGRYRLLDAKVTFHRELPKPGEVIRYDIHIDHFFRQGETWFFRFRFDGSIDGEPLLTMREGVAGFFTQQELDAGKGIIRRIKDQSTAKRSEDWIDFAPITAIETYDRQQIDALRRGDLAACFGEHFRELPLKKPQALPDGLLNLVDRVTHLEANGGEYGLGLIRAQMEVHPGDWFLTCHFIDDQVMPGTLMYECCLHTLRLYLMRLGWVGEADEVTCHPIIGVASKLLCRGQVLENTKTVTYEVHVREMGYDPEPYAIADAYMFSDDKNIVDITDMCVRFKGLSKDKLQQTWQHRRHSATAEPRQADETLVMDYDRIYALANGRPSDFNPRLAPFDHDRIIARFPRPPFLFMDRVVASTATANILQENVEARVQYDVPADAWYFAADRQPVMPYAVLLEIALQSCGWTAAYMGCALLSNDRLLFRNLGGNGTQFLPVTPETGRLETHVQVTKVSKTKEVILLFFNFRTSCEDGVVYEGDTYFGFFTETAMANQVGVPDAQWFAPTEKDLQAAETFPMPDAAPYPDSQMRMLDTVELFLPHGGRYGLGLVEGSLDVKPELWFFEAHFYQDPVWPGSLGLEAFQQLLKVYASRYFDLDEETIFQSTNLEARHNWVYRGQVLPTNRRVSVQAEIKLIDEETRTVVADGHLMVDGLVIYQINDFGITAL